jgi:hypothetical protein
MNLLRGVAVPLFLSLSVVAGCGGKSHGTPGPGDDAAPPTVDAGADDGGGAEGSTGLSDGSTPDGSTPTDGSTGAPDGSTGVPDGSTGVPDGSTGVPDGSTGLPDGQAPRSSKLDILFMIDNSLSMGDKQGLLAAAVPDMINRLVSPNCLDGRGKPTGTKADPAGNCPQGSMPEFFPVHNMHIGIVTSSLGGRGGDACPTTGSGSMNGKLSAHNDDRGELINRGGVLTDPTIESPVPDANGLNFLSWFPNVGANAGLPPPPTTAINTPSTLISDFTSLVAGVHEHGCGFEAQNEAWYRFLIQPDPFDNISVVTTAGSPRAQFNGVDAVILKQRAAFLRDDSLVAVVVLTDENEEVADPIAISGQAWAFEMQSGFPNSATGAAPQGTIECSKQDPNNPATTGPNDPNCTSCGFLQNDPTALAMRCPTDGTNGKMGFLDPVDDNVNLRFFQQKRRFGVSAGYPISRYVRGLALAAVPDRTGEHDLAGNYIGDQDAHANCVNPLYATDLPTDPTADLCHLKRGPRSNGLVFYMAIAGVPHQLLQVNPNDPNSPQKDSLTEADWTKIIGRDPEHYDFRGIDFHMVESTDPRTDAGAQGWANASSCSPDAGNTCDPINGREWATAKNDLQFSCVFDLRPQYGGVGKDCTDPKYNGACDCVANAINSNTQLCQGTTQVSGKAYPSLREMEIAHAMSQVDWDLGGQGIVSSLCPIHVQEQSPGDPLYGYRPAVTLLLNRIGPQLAR